MHTCLDMMEKGKIYSQIWGLHHLQGATMFMPLMPFPSSVPGSQHPFMLPGVSLGLRGASRVLTYGPVWTCASWHLFMVLPGTWLSKMSFHAQLFSQIRAKRGFSVPSTSKQILVGHAYSPHLGGGDRRIAEFETNLCCSSSVDRALDNTHKALDLISSTT